MKLYLSQSSNRGCKYLPIKISKRESSSQQRGKSYLHGHGWVDVGMEIRQVVWMLVEGDLIVKRRYLLWVENSWGINFGKILPIN